MLTNILGSKGVYSVRWSPFHPKLVQEPYPLKLEVPRIEAYDGTSDPEDHISMFICHMQFQTTREDLHCRVFPLTLKGTSYQWFKNEFTSRQHYRLLGLITEICGTARRSLETEEGQLHPVYHKPEQIFHP